MAPHLSDRRLRQGFAALLLGSALLSGSEALRRQSDLPTGTNPHGNSTRQAGRPVDGRSPQRAGVSPHGSESPGKRSLA